MDDDVRVGTGFTTAAGSSSCCGLPDWALHEPREERGRSPLCALPEWDVGGPTAVDGVARATRIPLIRDRRLYVAGSVGDCVYVLKAGIVKHAATADDGSNAIVRLVTAGGVSGLEAIAGLPYRHSAIVLHPGSACRIPVDVIKEYEHLDPAAAKQLCQAWQQAVDGLGAAPSNDAQTSTPAPAVVVVAAEAASSSTSGPTQPLIRMQ